MSGESGTANLLAILEVEQQRLRNLLAGRDEARLAQRPPNGDWSVLENARHLLFVEQGMLHRFVGADLPWSPLGLTPNGLRGRQPFSVVGTVAPATSGEVLEAWQTAHAAAAGLVANDTDALRTALAKHIRHLRSHIVIIERQIRRTGA